MRKFNSSLFVIGAEYGAFLAEAHILMQVNAERKLVQKDMASQLEQSKKLAEKYGKARPALTRARPATAPNRWQEAELAIQATVDRVYKAAETQIEEIGACIDAKLLAMKQRQLEYEFTARYEDGIVATLRDIAGWPVGRALLRAIDVTPRWARIMPFIEGDREWTNGSERPHYLSLALREGLVRHYGDRVVEGKGIGSDSTIRFITPALAQSLRDDVGGVAQAFEKSDPRTLKQADEILVHELTHALGTLTGHMDPRPVPFQPLYHTVDEFFAFLVANIYRSNKGLRGVRNDNHGEMRRVDITDIEFLDTKNNRNLLRQFRRDYPGLTKDLIAIKCEFNPLRRLHEEEQAAEKAA